LHYYHTQDSGQALLGEHRQQHVQRALGRNVGQSDSVTTSLQKVNGNTPFDYIQPWRQRISGQLAAVFGLQRAERKIVEVASTRTTLLGWGMPGLTSSLSYSRGTLDLTKADRQRLTRVTAITTPTVATQTLGARYRT
jgi:hypothetical protein